MIIKKKHYSDLLSEKVAALLDHKDNVSVLEAGCGSATHVAFPGKTELTGIDISKEQLNKNKVVEKTILGDIQKYPLPPNNFDAAVCWDVLEHLQAPVEALKNIFQTVKTGGLVIIAFPNLISFKGFATKYLPYRCHLFYYRIMGFSSKPFPTYLRYSMRPKNIERISVRNGFSVELKLYEGASVQIRKHKILYSLFSLFAFISRLVTFNKYDFALSECILILKKQVDGSKDNI